MKHPVKTELARDRAKETFVCMSCTLMRTGFYQRKESSFSFWVDIHVQVRLTVFAKEGECRGLTAGEIIRPGIGTNGISIISYFNYF